MPEPSSERRFPNSRMDWVLRVGIALIFLFMGTEKFSSRPDAPWVDFFKQVGFGQWLRYFTAILEILGAGLILASGTVMVGLVILGCVLAGAVLVSAVAMHRLLDAFVPFAFLCGTIAFWLRRRRV